MVLCLIFQGHYTTSTPITSTLRVYNFRFLYVMSSGEKNQFRLQDIAHSYLIRAPRDYPITCPSKNTYRRHTSRRISSSSYGLQNYCSYTRWVHLQMTSFTPSKLIQTPKEIQTISPTTSFTILDYPRGKHSSEPRKAGSKQDPA